MTFLQSNQEFISSLFRHNPAIPRLEPSEVTPAREEVFTQRGFSEAGIHPYLVKGLAEAGIERMTAVQVREAGGGRSE